MTPSRPMRRPRGSRRPVKAARRLGESGPAGTSQPPEGPAKERLARSQMTSPAGAATAAALPRTKRVRSRTERIRTFPIWGRR